MRASPVRGHVEVVCGPMFAGKTEELVRRVRRARLAGLDVAVFTHALDSRHGVGRVASHAGVSLAAEHVDGVSALQDALRGSSPDVVAVDEAQFFGPGLVEVVDELAARGVVVVAAGLSVTFDGRPFEPLPSLMATAEVVTRLTAVCSLCGGEAAFHQRTIQAVVGDALTAEAEHIGGVEAYQARCRHHLDAS